MLVILVFETKCTDRIHFCGHDSDVHMLIQELMSIISVVGIELRLIAACYRDYNSMSNHCAFP